MKTVYIVMWDNGQSYEDHDHGITAIFESEESAMECIKKCTEENKMPTLMSKEEYNALEDVQYPYEDYVSYAHIAWAYNTDYSWYLDSIEVLP